MYKTHSVRLAFNAIKRQQRIPGTRGLSVKGFISPLGNVWYQINRYDQEAWLPTWACVSMTLAIQQLADQQMFLSASGTSGQLQGYIAEVREFKERNIIEGPGWMQQCFTLPDRSVIQPAGPPDLKIVFPPLPNKCVCAGDHDRWLRLVAQPLESHPIPSFFMQATFLAPLLTLIGENSSTGYELVGPMASGKSAVLRLAASVVGSPGGNQRGGYKISFDTLLRTLDQQILYHGDLPIIVDQAELALAGESTAKRVGCFKAFAHQMQGNTEVTSDGNVRGDHRFVLLTADDDPLHVQIDGDERITKIVTDRVKTIRIADGRPHGVFEAVPLFDRTTSGQFMNNLLDHAQQHHGSAMRVYLAHLIEKMIEHPDRIKAEVNALVHGFRIAARVDLHDVAAVRLCDAFGRVAAAAFLAVRAGALPDTTSWIDAALACYRTYLGDIHKPASFKDRLKQLAAAPSVRHIGGDFTLPQSAEIESANVFVKHGRRGNALLIRQHAVEEVIHDWPLQRRRPEVFAEMKTDKDRHTTKCRLSCDGKPEPVFYFKLSD
ncbi:DUF927 domain-containing protein [Sphingomonas sp. PB4P5]|uniref:DUF927 domain-containing protein n=1 Tax=Parasphingomonas puruogangriensis TaxID=3096155 RepID=UPI002FC5FE99